MNARERFQRTFHFEKVDRAFRMPHWFFGDTIKRWQKEGMPADVHISAYFEFDRYETAPINLGLMPGFEEEVVYEDERVKVVRDSSGAKKKIWKDREIGMPQWLEYGLKDRGSWELFKERLNPHSPARYPLYWDDLKRCWKERDYPLGINAGSYYGWLRNWAGVEGLSFLFYDDPQLVQEMVNYIADFVIEVIGRAVEEVEFDFATIWEDMAMKTGPLCSPSTFKRFMLPAYKKVTGFLRDHGIDVIMVDSDGNLDSLIPLWIEGGVTVLYPLEVAAGCDARRYRKEYADKVFWIGNIDKRALRSSSKEVEQEVLPKVEELSHLGGFVPMVDHAVPPDISLENFQYYLELARRYGF